VLQAGETLAGYRIEAIAGVGGMGVVYRATQLSLERRVALKVLSTTLVANERFRERFRLEGRHAAALDHPNIIPVYEAGESDGLMYIAMRFVDGPTLADMIIQQALSGRETLRILAAIASALDAAHDSGLIHRDVKPHNVLMTGGGHPYLADFGITKGAQSSGLTNSGDFVGSIGYVSPEQIDGREVTPASDIYSLTAVLFHCLTGTLPYDHESEAALMHAHLFAPPPTISGMGIDAPRALDEVFARGMAKKPADRYDAASQLVDACAAAMAGAALERCPALVAGVPFGSTADPPADPRPRDDDLFPATPPAASEPPADDPWPRDEDVFPAASPATAVPPAIAPTPAPVADAPAASVLRQALSRGGDATAADRRRDMPAPAPPAAGRRPRSAGTPWDDLRLPALLVAAMVAVIGVPMLGYALGDGDEPAAPATARSRSLQISYEPPWEPAGATIRGLRVDGTIGLRRPDATVLVAGRLRDPAPGLDPAPAALRDEAARGLQAVRVRLGDRDGVRYAVPLRAGGSLWMVAFPDSKGWTTVACTAPGGRPDSACATVAATARARTGTPIGLGVDARVAAGRNQAIGTLDRARVSTRPRLRARSTVTRARAFDSLASADLAAAQALEQLEPHAQERGLRDAAVGALRSEAGILRNLARATRGRRRATYNRLRGSLRLAERRVRGAVRAF
jgi:serine/threonine protein kinase